MAEGQRGLLDNKLGDFLKGGATAALMGANPLLGLLAAPTFTRGRDKRAAENEEQRKQAKIQSDLQGLFSGTTSVPGEEPGQMTSVPTYQTPQGQQQLMGIMSQIDPAAAIQAAMPGQGQSAPTDLRLMDALGFPRTQEGFAAFNESQQGPIDPQTAALNAFLFQKAQEDAERDRNQAEREDQEFETEKAESANMLASSVENLMELYTVNEALSQDSGLSSILNQPGLPFSEIRRGLSGVVTPESAAMVDDFESLVNQIAIERLSTEGFDGNTNARFDAFTQTKPSFEFLGSANNKTILRNIKGALLADEAKGFVMPTDVRQRAEEFVRTLEDGQGPGTGVNTLEVGDIVTDNGVDFEYIGGPRGDPNSWVRK